ncbi:MAG: hypothetical protein MH208_11035 [Marinobacter sp.]|nr:hypothetical protein [Marinobacter sp.]
MNTSRLVLGIFGVGIAVVFAIDSTGYPDQAAQMPLIYSMAVALLSLGIVVQELVSLRRHRTVAVESSDAHLNDDANDDKSDAPSRYWGRLHHICAGHHLCSNHQFRWLFTLYGSFYAGCAVGNPYGFDRIFAHRYRRGGGRHLHRFYCLSWAPHTSSPDVFLTTTFDA